MNQLKTICGISGCSGLQCQARLRLESALHQYFKLPGFKPGQMEAMLPLLHGKDVFVRMATGSGKSMCMFLPPLAVSTTSMAVVISPLVGLMDQQVELLANIGVAALRVNDPSMLSDVVSGKYRFVFMSPESATTTPWCTCFSNKYVKKHLVLVAVDEAHCISDWGHDFRPSFEKIGGLRAFTKAPFIALTASANSDIQEFIVSSLHLVDPIIVSKSLDRPNIFFSVSGIKDFTKDLAGIASLLSDHNPEAIPKTLIFAQKKAVACKLFFFLSNSAAKREFVGMYHASLTHETKFHYQREFTKQGSVRCLVATVAFGMGMDISDIDLVIVYGVPDGMNQLYQLCGRAGRGGNDARAHIFYSTKQKKVDAKVKEFCVSKENCRRREMLKAIGSIRIDSTNNRQCCDVCNELDCISSRLRFETGANQRAIIQRKRRRARKISKQLTEQLKTALLSERDKYLREHPVYRLLGPDFVCPTCVIENVSEAPHSVESEDFIQAIPDLKPKLYRVLVDCLSCDSSSKKPRLMS